MNLAAGGEAGSSFRFFVDEGDDGILRRAFVASPRILFCGTLEGAIFNLVQCLTALIFEGKQRICQETRIWNCRSLENWRVNARDVNVIEYRNLKVVEQGLPM